MTNIFIQDLDRREFFGYVGGDSVVVVLGCGALLVLSIIRQSDKEA